MKKPLLTLLVIYLLTTLFGACHKKGNAMPLQAGETLPQLTVRTLGGETLTRDSLLGRPSVLILFTTTCPDCHRQLPEIESIWRILGGTVNVLAIARDDDSREVAAFWAAASLTMPSAAPGDRSVYDLFDRGARAGVPQVYVTDPRGVVVTTYDDTHTATRDEIAAVLSVCMENGRR